MHRFKLPFTAALALLLVALSFVLSMTLAEATALARAGQAGPGPAAADAHDLAADPDRLSAADRARLRQAQEAFRAGRHAAAYGRFAALADAGHAPSAEVALVMWRHGRMLFGTDWAASPGQVQRWASLAGAPARRNAQAAQAGAELRGE